MHFPARTLILASALIALSATEAAAVPETLGLTARVSDDGVPVDGTRTFAIRIYDTATGGSVLWNESDDATATDGLVYLTLGDQDPLTAEILDGGPLWIELQVGSTVLSPRLAITSTAYAVRAGVAEDTERFAGMPVDLFMPRGSSLTCSGTDKVTGLDASGSVVCSPDVDTSTDYTAGVGLALSGNEFSANLPGGTCPAGQKVAAVSASGVATCAIDLDTNTVYSAGTGLALTGTQFSVNLAGGTCPAGQKVAALAANGVATCAADLTVTLAGSGSAATAARSDHDHLELCPAAYSQYTRSGSGITTYFCVRNVTQANTWPAAAKACLADYGGSLCTVQQLTQVRLIAPTFSFNADRWLGDRLGNNLAAVTDATTATDDFDTTGTTSDSKAGYYCCLERRWW